MICTTCHKPVIEFGEVQGVMKYTHDAPDREVVNVLEHDGGQFATIFALDHIPVL